jgi:hypothetical protein
MSLRQLNQKFKNRLSYLKYLITKPQTIKVENGYCYAIYSNFNLVHEVNYGYGLGVLFPQQIDNEFLYSLNFCITPLTEEERAKLL